MVEEKNHWGRGWLQYIKQIMQEQNWHKAIDIKNWKSEKKKMVDFDC